MNGPTVSERGWECAEQTNAGRCAIDGGEATPAFWDDALVADALLRLDQDADPESVAVLIDAIRSGGVASVITQETDA